MHSFLRAAVALLLGLSGATLAGQERPPQQRSSVVLLLRDPSGQPVADAEGLLLPGPSLDLPALAGIDHRPMVGDRGDLTDQQTGRSDARGVLRFPLGEKPRAGAVVITTAAGLGALVPRVLPGESDRISLQPLGEVTTATGSEAFTLYAAHTAVDGTRNALPACSGTSVRLPAGNYEVWAHSEDGWIWQRLDVLPGRRVLLQFTGPAQALRRAEGNRVHPEGWPQVRLLDEATARCVLLGAALAAPLYGRESETGRVVLGQIPGPPRHEAIVWPTTAAAAATDGVRLTLRDDAVAANETVQWFVLRRSDAGSWRLLGAADSVGSNPARLPDSRGGDDWLLVLAPGRPPFATPWSSNLATQPLTLPGGVPLVVRCRTDSGEPAVDAVLEYVPASGEAAAVRARSDGRGQAAFGPVAAPGLLRVSDRRFANQQLELQLVPQTGVDLQLAAGASLRGQVTLPGGSPASGTVVTLRDATGRLRPAQRATVTDAEGAFRFAGLDESGDYVLFATANRDGHTWSAKLARVAPGAAAVELTLRDEDPVLGPGKDR